MNVGIISDAASHDLKKAVEIIKQNGIQCIEIQFIEGKEIGLHSDEDNAKFIKIIKNSGLKVTCLSTYTLKNVAFNTPEDNELYKNNVNQLKTCFELAVEMGADSVRTMGCRNEVIIFAAGGAEEFMVNKGAWEGQLRLFEPIVTLAEKYQKNLLVETCKAGMITNTNLGEKLVKEINSPYLNLLWDPYNALYFSEKACIETYKRLSKYIKHIHVKDGYVDIPNSYVETTAIGKGSLSSFYAKLGQVLREDDFTGGISLESIYIPQNGTVHTGLLESLDGFKQFFLDE